MKRIFFIPILIFIGFLAIMYFISPKYSHVKGLKAEVAIKEKEARERENYFSNLQAILTKLEDYQEALTVLNAGAPKKLSSVTLLNFFQISASENGLALESIPSVSFPQEQQEESGLLKLKEANFSMTLKGSALSFENFLKVLEKSSRLIDVENISLPNATNQLMNFNISAKVYYY